MNNCAFGLSSRSAAWFNITWFKSTFDSCVFFTLHTVVVKLIMPAICCIKCGFFFFFFFFLFSTFGGSGPEVFWYWLYVGFGLLVPAVSRIWPLLLIAGDLLLVAGCDSLEMH